MPPKRGTVEKKKEKIVADKTFGLKNKNKSKKVQQYISNVRVGVALSGKTRKQAALEEAKKAEKAATREAQKQMDAEMGALFKAVVDRQVVTAGVDPKTVICAYFKQGLCKRGGKCKFSHDYETTRKAAKIDLYTDPRHADTIDTWDQAKLEEVVAKKAGPRGPAPTEIVCKHFLDAIEQHKYGWFWQCPNTSLPQGCHYRHALPPGFVFRPKKAEVDPEDQEEEQTIEEKLEEERAQLDLSNCVPVTLERFLKWKTERKEQKIAEVEEKRKAAAQQRGGGRGLHVLSGRDLFQYDPTLFIDDDDAAGGDEMEIRSDAAEEEQKEARPLDEVEEEKTDDADGDGGDGGDGEGGDGGGGDGGDGGDGGGDGGDGGDGGGGDGGDGEGGDSGSGDAEAAGDDDTNTDEAKEKKGADDDEPPAEEATEVTEEATEAKADEESTPVEPPAASKKKKKNKKKKPAAAAAAPAARGAAPVDASLFLDDNEPLPESDGEN